MTSKETSQLMIWVDADACPKVIKEVIYKASERLKVPVCLVANSHMWTPDSPLIRLVQVGQGADVADGYIVEHVSAKDLVITADIPLAALIVEKNATAIDPRGELYSEENVGERLSVRDFMSDLRGTGVETRGPAPIGPKDKQRFANSFNNLLAKLLK